MPFGDPTESVAAACIPTSRSRRRSRAHIEAIVRDESSVLAVSIPIEALRRSADAIRAVSRAVV